MTPRLVLRYIRVSLLLTLGLLVTIGCGFEQDDPEPTGNKGTLRFLSAGDVDTLDPQGTSWLIDFRLIEAVYEPLLRVDPQSMQVVPAAAEAMPTVSEDGLTYTFTIREDAVWSTGEPLVAEDFVFAWRRILLPDFAADYSGLFFGIKGAEAFFQWRADQLAAFKSSGKSADQLWQDTLKHFDQTVGIKAIDDHTLEVRLAQPMAYFIELAAFAPFSPNHRPSLEPNIDMDADTGALTIRSNYFRDPEQLVGNGPYQLKSLTPKSRTILDASPTYWDAENVMNSRVVMIVDTEPTSALLRYEQGEADWYPGLPTALPIAAELVNADRDDVHSVPAAGTYYYLFNCLPEVDGQPNPLADARVRRALSLAVDRDHLVKYVTRMNQPIARTFVPPGVVPGYDVPTGDWAAFDPQQAKQLLTDAGHADGQGLNNLSILYNSGGGHENVAQAIANMWREHLGVQVQLEQVEKKTFSTRRRSQGFSISRGGWFGDYRDPTTFLDMLRKNDGNNDAKYHNPDYDQLLVRASRETDSEKRMALLKEAEAMMLAEQPLMPLYHYTNLELFDPEVIQGHEPNAWNVRDLAGIEVGAGR
jgi:oligopeptide transport system substrate-binding protein